MSDIEHICLADDGRLKAVYSDHDVLVLSPRGGMFAYIKGEEVVRQHCAFVVSKYADRLCAALSFRNMHLDSIVWVHVLEKTQSEQKFTLGYPLSYVRWSASKEAASAAECLQVRPGDACVWFVLSLGCKPSSVSSATCRASIKEICLADSFRRKNLTEKRG